MKLLSRLCVLLACLVSSYSSAGQFTQTVDFSNLNIVVECPTGCQENTGRQAYSFVDFTTMEARQGLSGLVLTQVTFHLQGTLLSEIVNPHFPIGPDWSGIASAHFPWHDIPIPGYGSIPRLSIEANASYSCKSGLPCFAEAETPFDITVSPTDFTAYQSGRPIGGSLDVNEEPQPATVYPRTDPMPHLADFIAAFAGTNNTFSLTYAFVPEPGTLGLLGIALSGLSFSRRRRSWT